MLQMLVSFCHIVYKLYIAWKNARKEFEKLRNNFMERSMQNSEANPQEDSTRKSSLENNIGNQEHHDTRVLNCSLCFGEMEHVTSTPCGHLFCWNCIQSSLRVKQVCPECREPVSFNKLVIVKNL